MNEQILNKKIIIALFGRSGAGKDTILNWIVSHIPNTHKIIPYTSRPPRIKEKDGFDYHFITTYEFNELLIDQQLISHEIFKDGWDYGIGKNDILSSFINVGIFTIKTIQILQKYKDLEILPIYIKTSDVLLLERSILREKKNLNCSEICRRFLADEKDFDDLSLKFKYETFENNYKTKGKLYRKLKQFFDYKLDEID